MQENKGHRIRSVKLLNSGFKLGSLAFSLLLVHFAFLWPCRVWALGSPDANTTYNKDSLEIPPPTPPSDFGTQPSSDRLFSPSVGQVFYKIAYEIADDKDITERQAEQAITLLIATTELDSRAQYILPDMIKLTCQFPSQLPSQEHSELVYKLLTDYTDEFTDLEVAKKAIQYLLDKLNSREQREKLLEELLKNPGSKNTALASELATLLGILKVEKTDLENAKFYLLQAYDKNKYNKLAFAKIAELLPEQVGPVMHLESLRWALDENPFDLRAALTFAQYAENLQLYQMSMGMYEYCVDLFKFLYPSEPLPSYIYTPWAISCYNTQRNRHKCLQIASQFRQSGGFNLLLEAVAGKAAAKTGEIEQARQIFQAAEDKARNLIVGKESLISEQKPKNKSIVDNQLSAVSLAWFYCFASQDANEALDWANRAYSNEPNSATSAAVLAYALVMNGQTELAKSIIKNYEHNQIADLALAQIQLAENNKDSAIETLKSAIAADPGSLEAERAKEILVQNGKEYIPPIDPDIAENVLRNDFGGAVVPTFISPDKIISVQINLPGSKFSYDSEFTGTIVITNNASHPLVISDDGLFKGNIRVDANITGDLNEKIPLLISEKLRPALFIKPDQSLLIPLHLFAGRLRKILTTCPQASLNIEFTAYIDPVITGEGKPTNGLSGVVPAKVVINRPGVELTGKYLQNRLDSFSRGNANQRIRIIRLFTGLLMEQQAMANREPLYKFMYADWMPDLLKSLVLRGLADDDWVVKVHTMAGLLSLSLDYDLTRAVAENLNDTRWPVRFMATYLLAKSQAGSFAKVLDWSVRYDQSGLIRRMAIALGAAVPQPRVMEKQSAPPKPAAQQPTDQIPSQKP